MSERNKLTVGGVPEDALEREVKAREQEEQKLKRRQESNPFDDPTSAGFQSTVLGVKQPPPANTEGLTRNIEKMPWLYAGAIKIAQGISDTGWTIYALRDAPRGNTRFQQSWETKRLAKRMSTFNQTKRARMLKRLMKDNRVVEVNDHPWNEFVSYGADTLTGLSSMLVTSLHLDLSGEAHWLKIRDKGGVPVGHVIIPPTWIKNLRSPEGKVEIVFGGSTAYIDPKEMLMFKNPHPENPYSRGASAGRSLVSELEMDHYATEFMKSTFYNHAVPPLYVHLQGASPEVAKRFEQRFLSKVQGPENAGRPFFSGGPGSITVKELTQSLESLQIKDLRRFNRDTVIEVLGIPPEIMGILENSNRSTIDASGYVFGRWVLIPRLEVMRSSYQMDADKEFGKGFLIEYDSPVDEDKHFQLQAMEKASWAFQADEWRNMAGHEDLEDSDKGKYHFVPFNSRVQEELTPDKKDEDEDIDEDLQTGEPRPEEGPGDEGSANDDDDDDDGDDDNDNKSVKKSANKSISYQKVEELVKNISPEILQGAIGPVLASLVNVSGQRTLTGAGIEVAFNMEATEVSDYLEEVGGNKIVGINDTTRSKVREALASGIEEGLDLDGIKSRVESVFDEARGPRAWKIARTETADAASFASLQAMEQANLERKQWITTVDDRTRDAHIELDGQIRGIREPFSGGGYQAMRPGNFGVAEQDINCRCVIVAVIDEEESRSYDKTVREEIWKSREVIRERYESEMKKEVRGAFEEQRNLLLKMLDDIG